MRVTNKMMLNNYLNNLNNNLKSMDEIQTQISKEKKINRLSDDPVGLITVMQCRTKLYKTEQYKKNIDNGLTWLTQTETSAASLNEVIQMAYEIAIEVSSDTVSTEDKAAAAELIAQLRDEIVDIGNSQSSDKYVFSGYNVKKAPFEADGSGNILYNGLDLTNDLDPDLIAEDEMSITYEIGYETTMDISIAGTKLFGMGDDNIYTVLDNFYNSLKSDADAQTLNGYIDKLLDNQSNVLSIEAKVGGMTNRLELLKNRYEDNTLSYTELQSKVEDVDLAEAVMNYEMAENVYTAALKIGADIVQLSLIDFLN